MSTMLQNKPSIIDRRLSVAPMMRRTDRHFRYLLRLISKHTLLYTEMITSGALLHGPRERLLGFHADESPLALQLGGSDPQALTECARIAEAWGYDEINLNIGCPSDRVQSGRFGACLMAEPHRVAECVAAMREACTLPVTIKTRIGIDDRDRYEDLLAFVEPVRAAGCEVFIIHARKAWLQGLSPKENRNKPPLRHERVHRLKRDFPELTVVINGGIESLEQARQQIAHVDGVMIGRAVYRDPFLLAEADRLVYGHRRPPPDRLGILARYCDYIHVELQRGTRLASMTRHLFGLFQGRPGARTFRRMLGEQSRNAHTDGAAILEALRHPGSRPAADKRNPLDERVS